MPKIEGDYGEDYPLDAYFANNGHTVLNSSIVFCFSSLKDLFDGKMEIYYFKNVTLSGHNGNRVAIRVPDYVEKLVGIPVKKYIVGDMDGGFARTVYVAQFPENFPVRAGLTVHDTQGSWSSYPAHSFEAGSLLSPARLPEFDEMFVYFTDPPGGWGIQTFSTTKIAMPFRDRDICHIPLSSHPVVAGPGYRLAYVWCYWGKDMKSMEKFGEHGRI